MKVTMVHDGNTSYPDPPLDSEWSDRKKLEWKAALVEHNSGIRVRIADGRHTVGGIEYKPHYSVQVGGSVMVLSFHGAWTHLNGVEAGARAARA